MTEDDKFRIELHRSDVYYGDPLAADRIEELLELNKELTLQLLATSGQAADALDKLAKAVEALREIIDRWDTPSWKDVEATGSVINRARSALVELKRTPHMLYGSIGGAFEGGALFRYPTPTHKITYDVDQDGNVIFCKMEKSK